MHCSSSLYFNVAMFSHLVVDKLCPDGEALLANIAHERVVTSVAVHMLLKACLHRKTLVAYLAVKRVVAGMSEQMLIKASFASERLCALRAPEVFTISVMTPCLLPHFQKQTVVMWSCVAARWWCDWSSMMVMMMIIRLLHIVATRLWFDFLAAVDYYSRLLLAVHRYLKNERRSLILRMLRSSRVDHWRFLVSHLRNRHWWTCHSSGSGIAKRLPHVLIFQWCRLQVPSIHRVEIKRFGRSVLEGSANRVRITNVVVPWNKLVVTLVEVL